MKIMDDTGNWKIFFGLADDFYRLQPWNWMSEDLVFGVQVPGSENVLFCVVMGSHGHPSLGMFINERGLEGYLAVMGNELRIDLYAEIIMTSPHLMLSYMEWEDLSFSQRKLFRSVGFRPSRSNAWPDIKEIITGRYPVDPVHFSAKQLIPVLEQSLEVARQAKFNKAFIHGTQHQDEEFLIRRKIKNEKKAEWENTYKICDGLTLKYKITYKPKVVEEILTFKHGAPIEVDLRMIPNPSGMRGSPDFFPFVLILANQEKHTLIGYELLKPLPSLYAMYECIIGLFISIIHKAGIRPSNIYIRNGVVGFFIRHVLKPCGDNIIIADNLPVCDKLFENIMSLIELDGI